MTDARLRAATRFQALRPARIHTEGQEWIVEIVDLSVTGARIRLPAGANIELPATLLWRPVPGLPELTLTMDRVWQEGDLCGLRFQNPSALARSVIERSVHFHHSSK